MELVLFFFTTNTWTMLKKQLLNKVLSLKQQFIEQIEMTVKSINIKNRTYYFFNDMINIKNFDSNLLKIDKESYKNVDIYYIGYIAIKKIDDYENICSVNPLYLIVNAANGYTEEENGSKYLVLDSTDKNKEVLKKYTELWDEIKNLIKRINGGKEGKYKNNFMKIKFSSDDNLPLGRILKLSMLTIAVRSVFEEDSKYYLQIFLGEYLYNTM